MDQQRLHGKVQLNACVAPLTVPPTSDFIDLIDHVTGHLWRPSIEISLNLGDARPRQKMGENAQPRHMRKPRSQQCESVAKYFHHGTSRSFHCQQSGIQTLAGYSHRTYATTPDGSTAGGAPNGAEAKRCLAPFVKRDRRRVHYIPLSGPCPKTPSGNDSGRLALKLQVCAPRRLCEIC